MKNDKIVKIDVFKGKRIRGTFHTGGCWFSVIDIIKILTESPVPRQYWGKIKARKFNNSQLYPKWEPLELIAEDGRIRLTDCANTEGILHIIQAIPSPKAKAIKEWLAQFANERMQDIEDRERKAKLKAYFNSIPHNGWHPEL